MISAGLPAKIYHKELEVLPGIESDSRPGSECVLVLRGKPAGLVSV
jgi:hypothetical protein